MGFWKNSKDKMWMFGVMLGAAFLIIGAACSQLNDIWQKAVLICLECIGIG